MLVCKIRWLDVNSLARPKGPLRCCENVIYAEVSRVSEPVPRVIDRSHVTRPLFGVRSYKKKPHVASFVSFVHSVTGNNSTFGMQVGW